MEHRTVYLLRHAKSSWKEYGLADHDRPLSKRGRRAAQAIAEHLRANAIEPALVLCSTAHRTRETLELIAPALPSASVELEPELYGAGAHGMLERLQRVPDAVDSVLVIGHNPGIEHLALVLARPRGALLDELEAKYPTGALATLTFAGAAWSDLEAHTADLVAFVRPRDLEDG